MARYVELRRHTDSDGDALTDEGVRAALDIGRGLAGRYELLVSSGAQRATQTLAIGPFSRPGRQGLIAMHDALACNAADRRRAQRLDRALRRVLRAAACARCALGRRRDRG